LSDFSVGVSTSVDSLASTVSSWSSNALGLLFFGPTQNPNAA
jgi:hypothetical protein